MDVVEKLMNKLNQKWKPVVCMVEVIKSPTILCYDGIEGEEGNYDINNARTLFLAEYNTGTKKIRVQCRIHRDYQSKVRDPISVYDTTTLQDSDISQEAKDEINQLYNDTQYVAIECLKSCNQWNTTSTDEIINKLLLNGKLITAEVERCDKDNRFIRATSSKISDKSEFSKIIQEFATPNTVGRENVLYNRLSTGWPY